MKGRFDVQWKARAAPLTPAAAAARERSAVQLVQRLLRFDDEALARLEGVAGADLVLVRGRAEALPWVDGVSYLGRAPGAPDLLVPTNLEATVPDSLLSRAVARAGIPPPVAVLVDRRTLVSFEAARPLDRATLQAWLDARGAGP